MTNTTFTIYELGNLACVRTRAQNGTDISAESLTAAKRHATREQTFQGTVLMIEDEAGKLVAQKKYGSHWTRPGVGWLGSNI